MTSRAVCHSVRFFALVALATAVQPRGVFASEILPSGFRPLPLGVHALVGGRIVIKPGEVLEEGTIVIRDGFIKAVGKEVPPPGDARVWDMKGPTTYAGVIDPYLVFSGTNSPVANSRAA